MRNFSVFFCVGFLGGCSSFPDSVREGTVEIGDVTSAIECELAAVASDPDRKVTEKEIEKWSVLTDLDLTLVRGLGADGNAAITSPAGLGILSVTPKLGVSGTDTRTGHLQFSTDIKAAKAKYRDCKGYDPSETRMGLANWFAATLKAVEKGDLAGVTYTKQFEIVATAGVRFGYTLVPVTNTVAADAGPSISYDRTSRFSVALAPPTVEPPKKPIPVYIVAGSAGGSAGAGPGPRTLRAAPSAPPSVANNPELYYLLQRKSPVRLAP